MQRTPEQWLPVLVAADINEQVAHEWARVFAEVVGPATFSLGDDEIDDFLGNVSVESMGFTRLEESLSYKTAERISKVFRSRIPTVEAAHPYIRQPRLLANKVYGGRLGNTLPDDGWDCRGSGLIQVTGLANLTALADKLGWSDPRALGEAMRTDKATALRASILWWEGNVPDAFINQPLKVRKAVNGPAALEHERTAELAARAELALQDTP